MSNDKRIINFEEILDEKIAIIEELLEAFSEARRALDVFSLRGSNQMTRFIYQTHLRTLKCIKSMRDRDDESTKTAINEMINNLKEMYQEANEMYSGMGIREGDYLLIAKLFQNQYLDLQQLQELL